MRMSPSLCGRCREKDFFGVQMFQMCSCIALYFIEPMHWESLAGVRKSQKGFFSACFDIKFVASATLQRLTSSEGFYPKPYIPRQGRFLSAPMGYFSLS